MQSQAAIRAGPSPRPQHGAVGLGPCHDPHGEARERGEPVGLRPRRSGGGQAPRPVVLPQGVQSCEELHATALAELYALYVPDLLHFGDSSSPSPDRSTRFQAACIAAALQMLDVEWCTVVGFSYSGFVVFISELPGVDIILKM
uniref:AB hydrolase-1 domain-containing protein n=1 Tax=Oryza punctata TaxID=4537 RepID=A0A0E0LCP0_ORYPU